MWSKMRNSLVHLGLEERILNGASIAAIVCLFFPWLSGEYLGREEVSYTGMQFYVSYIGATVLILHIVILLITILPILGGPSIVRRPWKSVVRLMLASHASVLTLASLSVLTRVTYEFARMEVRFGVYFTLVCSLIATLYAFLQWQEERQSPTQELFHHPEDAPAPMPNQPDLGIGTPPLPPPPPPLQPEEHNIRL